ncbi:MAG: choline transporter [Clostridiales bacterium]|nr:MAG: choline transporter [Clostridiales bacterium]
MEKKKESNAVYLVSLVVVSVMALWGLIFNESFGVLMANLMSFLTVNFNWLYLIAIFVFIIASFILAFSKYGKIKLGPDDSTPDYSTKSWFAMLFGAGMGIGLVFWGVSEPLSHFMNPPGGLVPGSEEAVRFAMRASLKHWGFHAWANYAIIGLGLAYFQFRKGYPGLISSLFIPLYGEKGAKGWMGKTIDILAIFATVAGVATSLGMGTLQINSGMNYVFGVPINAPVQIGIIAVITVLYIWTAVAGIEKGIALLGDINLYLAIGLLVLSVIVGPKLIMVSAFCEGVGLYLNNIIIDSLHLNILSDNSWTNGWTVFYWAWWIAWAPFVGSFIARISRGRTVKEFVMGVIIAPTLASFMWFGVFGGMGIDMISKLGLEALAALPASPETALFIVYDQYPLAVVLSAMTLVLLCTFFITSANSATFVLAMFSEHGDLNPSNKKKFIWGLIQSVLATALLLAGGLKPLQTASIVAAFPFIFIMFAAIYSTFKAFAAESSEAEAEKVEQKVG